MGHKVVDIVWVYYDTVRLGKPIMRGFAIVLGLESIEVSLIFYTSEKIAEIKRLNLLYLVKKHRCIRVWRG